MQHLRAQVRPSLPVGGQLRRLSQHQVLPAVLLLVHGGFRLLRSLSHPLQFLLSGRQLCLANWVKNHVLAVQPDRLADVPFVRAAGLLQHVPDVQQQLEPG